MSPPVCAGDWGDNTCVTQDSTHIYMCDDLGEDVTTNLATRPQVQVKYTARVATMGTAVSMLQNAQSVISTVRENRYCLVHIDKCLQTMFCQTFVS